MSLSIAPAGAAAPDPPARAVPAPDARGFETLGPVTRVERDGAGAVIIHAGARLRLDFLDDATLRVRLAPPGHDAFAGDSYAIDPDSRWPGPSSLEVLVGGDESALCTPALRVRVRMDACRLTIEDASGAALLVDEAGAAWRAGDVSAALSLQLRPGERLLGLGDKPLGIDRRGHRLENWSTDAFRYERGTDPLYKAIPFVLGILDGRAYGLFVDSTARSEFDIGACHRERFRVETGGMPLDYTVFAGATPLDVVRSFARRVGRTPMLPRWALGYHQCRYSYMSEDEVRDVAQGLRSRGFGCDALYFDIHYMDGFRVFTWDRGAFPDPAGLIAELAAGGFRSVVIVDPGVKADDPEYQVAADGLAGRHFCAYPDGRPFVGDVWPGPCYFPDFTRAATRRWWGDLHAGLLADGAGGVWNDMNEPAVFTIPGVEDEATTFPLDIRHDMDGRGADHAAAHNVYGMQMARATHEALRRLAPARRPFVITRAAYAGAQRFATTWTGDNSATWDHLRLAVEQCLSLAVSGMPFTGSDVGGFVGAPDGELFARWMQFGALSPLFRNHSSLESPRREPWVFGEDVERVARQAVSLRYRLIPYLYTALNEAATDGTPIIRALQLVHPDDEAISNEGPLGFYLGPDLLAYPVLEQRAVTSEVYLPGREGGWFSFHDGAYYGDGETVRIDTPLHAIPLFAGAGCVLPLASDRLHTDEPLERLTLRVYAGPARWSSALYDDAGDGWEHEDGDHWTARFDATDDGEELAIDCAVTGRRHAPAPAWDVELHGLRAERAVVEIDGVNTTVDADGGVLRVETGPFRRMRIVRGR